MRSKTYRQVKQAAPTEAIPLHDAVIFVKEHARKSFDESIELHVRLGIDASKSDQMVRGQVVLPSGAAKQPKVAVFAATKKDQAAALAAGAAIAGGEELLETIAKERTFDADVVVSSPDMMSKIAKVAPILGPLGLMPNPKTGTVSREPTTVVKELLAGKFSFKMDQLGNIHAVIGKASWDADKIVANADALLAAVRAARPASARGQIIRRAVIKSTMGVAVPLAV